MEIEKLRREVIFAAVTSRGPGGQNVNKVSSSAQLRWNVQYSLLVTEEQKLLILMKLSNKINTEGEVVLRSDEYRDLPRNKEKCLEKLLVLIKQALHRPKPRKSTKPTRSSRLQRLDKKSKHSSLKKTRQRVKFDD